MSSISSIGNSQAALAQQVSMKVASKTLDAARAQGDAVLSLLGAAVEVQQQSIGDTSGKGAHIDVQA